MPGTLDKPVNPAVTVEEIKPNLIDIGKISNTVWLIIRSLI